MKLSWTFVVFLAAIGATAVHGAQLVIDLLPEGSPPVNPVTLTVLGDRYDVPVQLTPQRRAQLTGVQEFVLDFIAANTAGVGDQLVPLWRPDERGNILQQVSNVDLFERNASFFRGITSSQVMARMDYGNFHLVFVHHAHTGMDDFVKIYPVLLENGNYYATNALSTDPVYAFFVRRYAEQLTQQIVRSAP